MSQVRSLIASGSLWKDYLDQIRVPGFKVLGYLSVRRWKALHARSRLSTDSEAVIVAFSTVAHAI